MPSEACFSALHKFTAQVYLHLQFTLAKRTSHYIERFPPFSPIAPHHSTAARQRSQTSLCTSSTRGALAGPAALHGTHAFPTRTCFLLRPAHVYWHCQPGLWAEPHMAQRTGWWYGHRAPTDNNEVSAHSTAGTSILQEPISSPHAKNSTRKALAEPTE